MNTYVISVTRNTPQDSGMYDDDVFVRGYNYSAPLQDADQFDGFEAAQPRVQKIRDILDRQFPNLNNGWLVAAVPLPLGSGVYDMFEDWEDR